MYDFKVPFGHTPVFGRPAKVSGHSLTGLHLPNSARPKQRAAVAALIERAIREGQALIVHDPRLTDDDIQRIRTLADEHGRTGHIVDIRDAADAPTWHPYDPGAISYPQPTRFSSIHLHRHPERLRSDRYRETAYALMDAAGFFLAGNRDSDGEAFSSADVLAAALDEHIHDKIIELSEREGMRHMAETVELHRLLVSSPTPRGHKHRTLLNAIRDSVESVGKARCSARGINFQHVLKRQLICIVRTKPGSEADTLVAADLYHSMQRYYMSNLGSDAPTHHPGSSAWPLSTIVIGDTSGLRVREEAREPHHLSVCGLARHCHITLAMPTETDELPAVVAFEGAKVSTLAEKQLGLHRLNWQSFGLRKGIQNKSALLKVA